MPLAIALSFTRPPVSPDSGRLLRAATGWPRRWSGSSPRRASASRCRAGSSSRRRPEPQPHVDSQPQVSHLQSWSDVPDRRGSAADRRPRGSRRSGRWPARSGAHPQVGPEDGVDQRQAEHDHRGRDPRPAPERRVARARAPGRPRAGRSRRPWPSGRRAGYTAAAGATPQNRPSRASVARAKSRGRSRAPAARPSPEVAVGLGLGHAGRLAVDRVAPAPWFRPTRPGPAARRGPRGNRPGCWPGPGCSRRASSSRPARRGRARLRTSRAEDERDRQRPGSRPAGRAAPRAGPAGATRPARTSARRRASRLGRQSAARPNASPPRTAPRRPRAGEPGQRRGDQERRRRLGHHRPALPDQHRVAGHDRRGRQRPPLARDPNLAPAAARQPDRAGPEAEVQQRRCPSGCHRPSDDQPGQQQRVERRPIGGRPSLEGNPRPTASDRASGR